MTNKSNQESFLNSERVGDSGKIDDRNKQES